jgi:hypothetical protein
MLFLYRPRQTWMPYRLPRDMARQTAYNATLQDRFDATRRAASRGGAGGAPITSEPDLVARLRDLAQLHESGVLDDAEFRRAKAKVLESGPESA